MAKRDESAPSMSDPVAEVARYGKLTMTAKKLPRARGRRPPNALASLKHPALNFYCELNVVDDAQRLTLKRMDDASDRMRGVWRAVRGFSDQQRLIYLVLGSVTFAANGPLAERANKKMIEHFERLAKNAVELAAVFYDDLPAYAGPPRPTIDQELINRAEYSRLGKWASALLGTYAENFRREIAEIPRSRKRRLPNASTLAFIDALNILIPKSFGQPMYGVVATLADVIYGAVVTAEQVGKRSRYLRKRRI